MAGANLELFRFAFYLSFPLGFMLYFGDPRWYDKFVRPYRGRFEPPDTGFRHPRTSEELHESLEQVHHGAGASNASVLQNASVRQELALWRRADAERQV
ncbi:hypothetical protein MSPP1_001033 [Malassezia sp. CBS 17886]|nr:hypothetical protein MSPP1_001033 [Malassezia sp. CBS 17886]